MNKQPSLVPNSRYTLRSSLLQWFLLIALLPLSINAWLNYQQSVEGFTETVAQHLEQSAHLKAEFIQNWFDYRFMDLNTLAKNENNVELLKDLRQALQHSNLSLAQFIKSDTWSLIVNDGQQAIVNLSKHYDYIYDVFLIDIKGNILFTLAQESDIGTNLFKGPYSTTRFAHTAKASLKTEQALFSDLERYAPSENVITGFITSPMLDKKGDKIGLMAVQIKLDRVNNLMLGHDKNSNLMHYLVGYDGLLRTPINKLNMNSVLIKTVESDQFKLWQSEHGEHEQNYDNGKEPAISYLGPSGKKVIGLHQTVRLPGVSWGMISETYQDTALIAATNLQQTTFIIFILTALLVFWLGIYKARHIANPIIKLANASMAVAAGKIDQKVQVDANNEIGVLAKAFNHMLDMRKQYEQTIDHSHKEAQKALSELAAQKFAMDQHNSISITDTAGTITFVNEKFCELSGYSKDELIGQNHRMNNSGYHNTEYFTEMYRDIISGKVWRGEFCNKAKDGHLYWQDTTIVPFMKDDGRPESYIAIRTDVTQRKHAEQELIFAKEEAEKATRSKSEFLANMSHEIRSPMNGVLGMLELLHDTRLQKDQKRFVQTASDSATSLMTIINDILDFSKIEAGHLVLENTPFNLRKTIEDAAALVAKQAVSKGLEINCYIPTDLPNGVSGDPLRLRQILINLTNNAIKFTPDGEVNIYVSREDETADMLELRFEIIDTGLGIPEEIQGSLFSAFTQADSSTTRKFGGTGLGLSISRQLAELMGGKINVKSTLGKGSTFWFTTKFDKTNEQFELYASSFPENLNILAVDDNATNREILSHYLSNWNINHDMAKDAESALVLLHEAASKNEPYQTVILDYHMPGTNGIQLATKIKSDASLATTRLVLLSSVGDADDVIRQSGIERHLVKPVRQSDLYDVLLQSPEKVIKESQQTTPYEDVIQSSPFSGFKVLLVDDMSTNQIVGKEMLMKLGINTDIAENGQEAVNNVAKNDYDLVLMDCQMPIMDGYTATEVIRENEKAQDSLHLPIIALTANAMQGDKERCLTAGMDDYLSKPFTLAAFEKILTRWLLHDQHKDQLKEQFHHVNAEDKYDDKTSVQMNETLQTTEANKESAIDETGLKELKLLAGTNFSLLVDSFKNDAVGVFAALREAAKQNVVKDIRATAHALKGISANMAAKGLAQLCETLEQQAGDDKIINLQKQIGEIEAEYKRVYHSLRNLI